jgi:hypothetical protein
MYSDTNPTEKTAQNGSNFVAFLQQNNTPTVDKGIVLWYTVIMTLKKKRCDRNHVVYRITCVDTGDEYIGITVALGQAFLRSVKVRFQKHVSRAMREDKEWNLCAALREYAEASWTYEVLEVVRGRKPAHQRERELIGMYQPTLNTF